MYKIGILFQNRDFEHDVYELIKAFYPGNEIVSFYEEDDADYDIRFRVSRDEEGYTISYNNGIEKETAHGAVIEGQSSGEASDALISCNDAHDIRRKNKDAIKYALYQMLSKATGKTLPWGNLTGIRPVKMAMGMLESGMKNTEIARYMREQYLVSPEKTALAVTIANRERDILKNIDYENGYSLYVGIPFCPSICLYCSFSSYPLERWRKYVEDYLDALIKEIQAVSKMMKNRKLDTVYIGGGTPTTLEPDQLRRLLGAITEYFRKSTDHESGNPGYHWQTSYSRTDKECVSSGKKSRIRQYQYGSDRGSSRRRYHKSAAYTGRGKSSRAGQPDRTFSCCEACGKTEYFP